MKKPSEIINDPVKATLFGKFYEKIISRWLKECKEFKVLDGKPRVYWKDVEPAKVNSEGARRLKTTLEKYKKEKYYCTPDGLLEKHGRYYIWEAKNWPFWTEGKKPIDQLRDVLFSMPLVLAPKAVHRGKEYEVHGILFSWWSKPDGIESLLEEINGLIAPRTFEIVYTDELLEDCIKNKYQWYVEIIMKEKQRIDEFWRGLLGEP
ncbi:MAG: hypothetical protein ACP5KW_10615 [Thermoproteota archaeon]|jgi:hypothetical protein